MQEANQKPHNNSYESGASSSSSASSSTNGSDPLAGILRSEPMNPNVLAELMLNPNDSATLCNISAEEGIFPNICKDVKIEAPSYVPEFNYDDTTPLVYSWLPIVSGYLDDDYNNLHNFSHVKLSDISDVSDCPDEKKIPDEKIVLQESTTVEVEKTIEYELENSCNAMDISLGHREEVSVVSCDLSFNGKIDKLKEIFVEDEKPVNNDEEIPENPILVNENALEDVTEEISEEERIRNESFEMLKKEDSTLMLMINEKSPEVLVTNDIDDEESPENEDFGVELEVSDIEKQEFHPKTRDEKLLRKFKVANTCVILPPPSKTRCTMSLTEMLSSYKENVDKMCENAIKLETGSLFKPTCSINESEKLEWPQVTFINTLDIMYNRNQHAEFTEEERMKFCEKFVGTETATSYNFKVSLCSAKKKLEKIKLANPSPNSRLKKLTGRRRAQFSLDSLKSLQSSQTVKLQIDSNLLQGGKKRNSSKKKTPGSGKRKYSLTHSVNQRPPATRSSSKRALFTSPHYTNEPSTSRDISSRFPRKNLFACDDKKRRRSPSPSHDNENRFEKQRRINSPAKLMKSQTFSIASTSMSSSLENLRRRDIHQRTQSEMNLSKIDSWKPLRYERPWDGDTMKKKILFNVSSILNEKGIHRQHPDFKTFTSTLVNLVKRIFKEFYNPRVKSDSAQLKKFASLMVSGVIQKLDEKENLKMTREHLNRRSLVSTATSSSNENRLNSSFSTFPVLNNSVSHESSLNSSLGINTSKNNDKIVLRENFQLNRSAEKSATKFRVSESNLVRHNSMPNPGILKAKRQISF